MARGKPRKFKDEQQLIDLFRNFCDDIVENGFCSIPSQTNFCRWLSQHYLSCDRKTIYNSLNEYFPTIKKEFEAIQGDVIAEGAMLGKYNSTMSIFSLKNWCKWQDSIKDDNSGTLEKLDEVLTKIIGGDK